MAMNQEKYTLTWYAYSDHLKSMMKELMMNEDFADVTLVTEDKRHIKANVNILSACSPVFKDTLKKEKNSSQIMYLRGIQSTEMESIMQFIYLGEATLHEERMGEFLAVAKSLEIKELCNTETETNDEPEDEPSTGDPSETLDQQTVISDGLKMEAPQEGQRKVVKSVHGNYECNQCDYQTIYKSHLKEHIQRHDGIKYACYRCDSKLATQRALAKHVQAKHEGGGYACDQCDYVATTKAHLTRHTILKKHIQF